MKSGNLNFLEPCGPLQACNGTAAAFTAKLQEKTPAPKIIHRLKLVLPLKWFSYM